MFIFATSKVLYEPLTYFLYGGILNKMWVIELQTLGTETHSMGFNVSSHIVLWHIIGFVLSEQKEGLNGL